MDFIIWMAMLALRICLVVLGFWIFRAILKNGPETFKEIAETLGVVIRALCLKTRRYIAEKLRKENGAQEPPAAEVEAEGSVE